ARPDRVAARIGILAEGVALCVDDKAREDAEVAAVRQPGRDERVAAPVARRDPGRALGGRGRHVALGVEGRARAFDELAGSSVPAEARTAALPIVDDVPTRTADDAHGDAVARALGLDLVVTRAEIDLDLARLARQQRAVVERLALRCAV